MELPARMRESLVEDLDEFLEAFPEDPDPEPVATYVIELLEAWADDLALDELIFDFESEAQLDASLQETLEEEMGSNDEFELTGEEILSLLDRLVEIAWEEDDEDEGEDEDEDEDEVDEL